MSDLKISQLPLTKELTGKEIFPLVKDGSNVAAEGSTLKTFVSNELSNSVNSIWEAITNIQNSIESSIAELDTINNMIV